MLCMLYYDARYEQLFTMNLWHSHTVFMIYRYIRMAREFADALQYIHTQFHPDCIIIHRDLKPDNIGRYITI